MTRPTGSSHELALSQLAETLHRQPHLDVEAARARREFFGVGADQPQPAAAEFRFAEWFVLERESEVLGAVPAQVPAYARGDEFTGSLAGVFLVQNANGNEVEVQDLQDDELLELDVPEGSLLVGDLVVGRLYPTRAGFRPSSAAAVFRPGRQLGEAFVRDVARLALDRRLQQVELEHLLLRRADRQPSPTAPDAPSVPIERLEADLEQLLTAAGAKASATQLSQRLRLADRPGQVIGPLLEELAFDTQIDLDSVRRLLLELWNAWLLRRDPSETMPGTAPGAPLGERLVRTLDDGLQRHQDVDELFAQLERMAGLEPGAADDEDNPFDREDSEAGAGANLGGNLEALVTEYLWETGREAEPGAAALRSWPGLQANAALPHDDVEQVTGQDLTRLLLHVYLGAAGRTRAAAVQTAFAELQRFYGWLEETQELPLTSVLDGCRTGLLANVERLSAASMALSQPGTGGRPTLLRLCDLSERGFGCVDDDGEHFWFAAEPATAGDLRVGDLLLGAVVPGPRGASFGGQVVVLPADAKSLVE